MKRCQILTRKALKINAPCKYDSCTFNGIWNGGGGDGEKNLYLSSSFYWTALDVGFIINFSVLTAKLFQQSDLSFFSNCLPIFIFSIRPIYSLEF